MNFLTLSPDNQNRLAVAVPIVALVLSLFVVYPAWGRYVELNARIEQQRTELQGLKDTPTARTGHAWPAARDLASEAPDFLRQVRELARETGCTVGNTDVASTYEPKKIVGPLRPVHARIEIDAPYSRIREFIARIGNLKRLCVVTEVFIAPPPPPSKAGMLRAAIGIDRYVTVRPRGVQDGARP